MYRKKKIQLGSIILFNPSCYGAIKQKLHEYLNLVSKNILE